MIKSCEYTSCELINLVALCLFETYWCAISSFLFFFFAFVVLFYCLFLCFSGINVKFVQNLRTRTCKFVCSFVYFNVLQRGAGGS